MNNSSTPARGIKRSDNDIRCAEKPAVTPISADVRRVVIFTYPGCFLGETIKLLELLTGLNDFSALHGGLKIQFVIQFYSPIGGSLPSPSSRSIHLETLTIRGPVPIKTDLVIIAHGPRAAADQSDLLASQWLQAVCPGARQIVALGSGAMRLAAAGILNNRRATTHSALMSYLADCYPLVSVEACPGLLIDGNILTTGEKINLRELAQLLLSGPQSLPAPARALPAVIDDRVSETARIFDRSDSIARRVTLWWLKHLDEDLSMARSARFLSMSERSFRRHFQQEVGYSPYLFLLLLRLELARQALIDSDLPIDKIARRGGLHDGQQMARLFRKFIDITPNQYRVKYDVILEWTTHPLYAAMFNCRDIPIWLKKLQLAAAPSAAD